MPYRPKTRQRTKQGNSIIPKIKFSGSSLASMYGVGGGDSPSGVVQANQSVSPSYQPEGFEGVQYYGKDGQITEQPFADTRNWWQRNISRQPNTAEAMNLGIQSQVAQQQALMPGALQQRRAEGDIALQTELAKLEQAEQFANQNAPVVNPLYRNEGLKNVTEPGQVPFQFQGDPQQAIYDRNMPYSGENAASKVLNSEIYASGEKDRLRNVGDIQRQYGQVPGNELTPSQLSVIQSMQDLERNRIQTGIDEAKKPRTGVVGNFLVNLETGEPIAMATGEHKIEGQPIMKDGKYMGMSPESYTKPAYNRMTPPKKVGNAYGDGQLASGMGNGGSQSYYTPMSGQTEYFPSYQDGQKVAETSGRGSAPVTEPSISTISRPQANGQIDISPYFNPDSQKKAEEEYKRRMQQRMQRNAWYPTDYSNVFAQ
jgi:hypothetical protein